MYRITQSSGGRVPYPNPQVFLAPLFCIFCYLGMLPRLQVGPVNCDFLPTPTHQPNPKLLREGSLVSIYRPFLGWCFGVSKKLPATFLKKVMSIFFANPNCLYIT